MHQTAMDFAVKMVNEHQLNDPNFSVLELGSLDVNGSVRNLLSATDYLGVDMQDGHGVDLVCDAANIVDKLGDSQYDVVVCTEMLEHDATFWKTLANIGELLVPAGYLLLTARGATADGHAMFEHAFPYDFYRFMPQAPPLLLDLASCDPITIEQDRGHPGFLALGRRRA